MIKKLYGVVEVDGLWGREHGRYLDAPLRSVPADAQ